jgi:helix-turn-helix, Psq domain
MRNYKRKTTRPPIETAVLSKALAKINAGVISVRSAAKAYGIPKSTLLRYHIKQSKNVDTSALPMEKLSMKGHKKVINTFSSCNNYL